MIAISSVSIEKGELTRSSPLGKFTPGGKEIKDAFENMWAEAEKNRTKWSCELTPSVFRVR